MQCHFTTIKLNKIPKSFAERNSYLYLNNAAEQLDCSQCWSWRGDRMAVWRVAAAGWPEGPEGRPGWLDLTQHGKEKSRDINWVLPKLCRVLMSDLTFRYNGRDWEDKIGAAHLETLKVTLSCLAISDLNQALVWKMAEWWWWWWWLSGSHLMQSFQVLVRSSALVVKEITAILQLTLGTFC